MTGDVDPLIAAGANCFRLLFAWEALMPTTSSTLATLTGNFKAYATGLFGLVDYITSKGCTVVLDVHPGDDGNFAAYRGMAVGGAYQGVLVATLLANLWQQIAAKYVSNPLVQFGVVNEPHDIPVATWFAAGQGVVNAIRGTGSKSRIWMPGVDWTGADSWMNQNAGAYNIVDPAGNTGVQVHMYFDPNSGGGTTQVQSPTIGSQRCAQVTAWARSKGLKLLLAETGLQAAAPLATQAWQDLQTFLAANQDVWQGWCFWAAGPPAWWGGYQFYCGAGSAQLSLISGNLK
jgi:endoglucanase